MKRILILLVIMTGATCMSVAQNTKHRLNMSGGLSLPFGEFGQDSSFAGIGTFYSLSANYITGKFGISFAGGYFTNSTEKKIEDYALQNNRLGMEYQAGNWKTTYFATGPMLSLPFGKTNIDLFARVGMAGYTIPELLVTLPQQGMTNIPIYTRLSEKMIEGLLNTGLRISYNITKNLAVNLKAEYLTSSPFNMSYVYKSSVLGKYDPDLGYKYSEISKLFNQKVDVVNIAAGLTISLGGSDQAIAQKKQKDPYLGIGLELNKTATPTSVNNNSARSNRTQPLANIQKDPDENDDQQTYKAPQVLSPADCSVINGADATKPVTFRWIPVIPKPRSTVVYNIKVIEIKQGQSATSAARTARPLLEEEVTNQNQLAGVLLSKIPIADNSQYGWYVQATNKSGKPFGENNGTSSPAAFKIGENEIDIFIDTLEVECCDNGTQHIQVTIKNDLDNNNTTLNKIIITGVNGNFGNPMDISSFVTPALPFNFLPSSTSSSQGRETFTAIIDCDSIMDNLVVKAEAERNTNMGMVSDEDLESDTLDCICTDCESIVIIIPEGGTLSLDSTLHLQTPVSVSPNFVTKIKAHLISFEFQPESDDCTPCNRNSNLWGNFISATLNDNNFSTNGTASWQHELYWLSNNTNGATLNGDFIFKISLPPILECCNANVKFCIRYIFEFANCTVCEKVVCYSHSVTNN